MRSIFRRYTTLLAVMAVAGMAIVAGSAIVSANDIVVSGAAHCNGTWSAAYQVVHGTDVPYKVVWVPSQSGSFGGATSVTVSATAYFHGQGGPDYDSTASTVIHAATGCVPPTNTPTPKPPTITPLPPTPTSPPPTATTPLPTATTPPVTTPVATPVTTPVTTPVSMPVATPVTTPVTIAPVATATTPPAATPSPMATAPSPQPQRPPSQPPPVVVFFPANPVVPQPQPVISTPVAPPQAAATETALPAPVSETAPLTVQSPGAPAQLPSAPAAPATSVAQPAPLPEQPAQVPTPQPALSTPQPAAPPVVLPVTGHSSAGARSVSPAYPAILASLLLVVCGIALRRQATRRRSLSGR